MKFLKPLSVAIFLERNFTGPGLTPKSSTDATNNNLMKKHQTSSVEPDVSNDFINYAMNVLVSIGGNINWGHKGYPWERLTAGRHRLELRLRNIGNTQNSRLRALSGER